MCFSAGASFGSAAVLMAVGATTSVVNASKPQRMIAAVPLLFGFQQAAEGIIWQTMGQNNTLLWHQIGVITFLGFALVVWPSWLPWAVYRIETNENRKKILRAIAVLGSAVSLLAAWAILIAGPQAYVTGHSLGYAFTDLHRSWNPNLEFLLYTTPTLLPFFISSLRTVKNAGYLVVGSMIITQYVNKEASTSVWCFFAALISFYIAVNVLWIQKGKIT